MIRMSARIDANAEMVPGGRSLEWHCLQQLLKRLYWGILLVPRLENLQARKGRGGFCREMAQILGKRWRWGWSAAPLSQWRHRRFFEAPSSLWPPLILWLFNFSSTSVLFSSSICSLWVCGFWKPLPPILLKFIHSSPIPNIVFSFLRQNSNSQWYISRSVFNADDVILSAISDHLELQSFSMWTILTLVFATFLGSFPSSSVQHYPCEGCFSWDRKSYRCNSEENPKTSKPQNPKSVLTHECLADECAISSSTQFFHWGISYVCGWGCFSLR